MKKLFLLLTVALLGQWASAQEPKIDYSVYDDKCNFYIANDLGRNGYYDQKPIAELMGVMAEEVGPNASSPPATSTTSRACAPRKTPCG